MYVYEWMISKFAIVLRIMVLSYGVPDPLMMLKRENKAAAKRIILPCFMMIFATTHNIFKWKT